MEAVGTPAWARRTGGQLTLAQAGGYTLGQLGQQARRLGRRRPRTGAATPDAGAPAIPASGLAADITGYTALHLPAPLLNHSWRVWVWAHALLPAGDPVDPDLLFAASLLHDTGFAAGEGRTDRRCFTVRSAEIAAGILERAGCAAAAVDTVAAAIIGHMNVHPPDGADTLTTVLHAATHLDVTGARAERIAPARLADTQLRYPRTGFAGCFSGSCRREFLRAPLTRAGLSWAIGLPLALRLNPIA